MRGNISIARRLQDPLAELVKIDPQSIGVGQYQHDVNQKKLAEALRNVVEDCVNEVGVNLNTASAALLAYVSGLTQRTAHNIVRYRQENGSFTSRDDLNKVSGIGATVFQQAAGFLRIPDGDEPLDNTSIHPESYEATYRLLEKFHISDIRQEGKHLGKMIAAGRISPDQLAEELQTGRPTLADILENLAKPGRDPRDQLPTPILKTDVLSIEDLKVGLSLQGTVRNVVDFGAFVDIGVKTDGLIHISQLGRGFVKNPHDVVLVGDIVTVEVLSIDADRQRIGLRLKEKQQSS